MFRPFDPNTTPTVKPGEPEPLDTVFHDPAYPGFFCGQCSHCGEKLFTFSPPNARTFVKDHAHTATAASVPASAEQASLF